MTSILLLKEKLKSFYGKNDMFIVPIAKFVLALVALCLINGNIGYMESLKSIFVVVIISLICAVMPNGTTVLCITLVMVGHLFSRSLELAGVTLIIFCIMYLFYFRFTAKSSVWLVLTLVCCLLKIPYVVPVAAGLLTSAFAVIPVAFGVIIYYIMEFSKAYVRSVSVNEPGDMFDNFKVILSGLMDKEILLICLSFALTITIVYVIRRLSIDYAWIYAIVAGALTDFVMLLVGNVIFSTKISFFGILVGLILSVVIGYILYIICFSVDYSRTERVQFEDDNYYYYVKAVPKYSVAVADVKVKKINTQKKRKTVEQDMDDIDLNF